MRKTITTAEGRGEAHPSPGFSPSRRRFLRFASLAAASGTLMGVEKSPPVPAIRREGCFPVEISEGCRRMDQKNTIFCRLLWDRELVQKIEASIDPSGLLAVFTVAWLLSCILEGESRAAGMGRSPGSRGSEHGLAAFWCFIAGGFFRETKIAVAERTGSWHALRQRVRSHRPRSPWSVGRPWSRPGFRSLRGTSRPPSAACFFEEGRGNDAEALYLPGKKPCGILLLFFLKCNFHFKY